MSHVMMQVKSKADQHNVPVHMDGARVMNAAVSLDEPPKAVLQHVDSVSVCLSKVKVTLDLWLFVFFMLSQK